MSTNLEFQTILEHTNDLKTQMESIQNHFDDRMNTHETIVRDHFTMCNQLCMSKIDHVDTIANKAHERLDKHRDKFIDVCAWRHKLDGKMWVLPVIVTIIVTIFIQFILRIFNGGA